MSHPVVNAPAALRGPTGAQAPDPSKAFHAAASSHQPVGARAVPSAPSLP